MIESAWNTMLHILNTMPAWLAAVLVGWAASAGVTQSLKFVMPMRGAEWDEWEREVATRAIAFASAFVPALAYAINAGVSGTLATILAILAGLWSPVAFMLLQRVLRRWWPWAADVLSGDVRGVLRGGE